MSITDLLVGFMLKCMFNKVVYLKESVYPKTQNTTHRIEIVLEQQQNFSEIIHTGVSDREVRRQTFYCVLG